MAVRSDFEQARVEFFGEAINAAPDCCAIDAERLACNAERLSARECQKMAEIIPLHVAKTLLQKCSNIMHKFALASIFAKAHRNCNSQKPFSRLGVAYN